MDKAGDDYVDTMRYYNPSTKIDALDVEIFNGEDKSVKKNKLKDHTDISAVSSGQLYTEARIKYISFMPTFYTYTVKYKIQTTSKNTLFIPR